MVAPAVGSALLTLALLVILTGRSSVFAIPGGPQRSDPYRFQECHYDPDTINPIQYRFFSVGSAYERAFKQAEAAWDATSAPGYFEEHSTSWDPEINVTDEYRRDGSWAQTTVECIITIGLYYGNEVQIEFNTRIMDGLTAHKKKIIAMHELGHAYGLDELYEGCRLMRQSYQIFACLTAPTADDVAGVTALYP